MGRFVFTVAVGVWLGTIVSFSFVLLPGVHAALPDGKGREVLRQLFPRYHLVGIVCGLIALAIVAMAPRSVTFDAERRLLLGAPVAVALLCTMIGRQVLLPRLAALRTDADGPAFESTHRIAAMLNTTALAMLALALAAVSTG